jgi:hypothetical protein
MADPYQSFSKWADEEQKIAHEDDYQSEKVGIPDKYLNELKQRQRREEAEDFYRRMEPIYKAEEEEEERIRLAEAQQTKKWAEEDEKKKLENKEKAEAEKKRNQDYAKTVEPILVSGFDNFRINGKAYKYIEVNGIYDADTFGTYKKVKGPYIIMTEIKKKMNQPMLPVWGLFYIVKGTRYKMIAFCERNEEDTRIKTLPLNKKTPWTLILDDMHIEFENIKAISYPANIIETKEKEEKEGEKWRLAHPIRTAVGSVPKEYRRNGGRKTKHSTKKNKRKTRKTKKTK